MPEPATLPAIKSRGWPRSRTSNRAPRPRDRTLSRPELNPGKKDLRDFGDIDQSIPVLARSVPPEYEEPWSELRIEWDEQPRLHPNRR